MKKTILILILLLLLPLAIAQTNNTQPNQENPNPSDPNNPLIPTDQIEDPGDVSEVIKKEFNISPNKIPTTPEEIEREYLQREWTEVIANSTVLGPAHRGLTKISPVFVILFANPYELSLTLFFIILFWIMIAHQTEKIITSWGFVKKGYAFLIAIVLATILAQAKILKAISTLTVNIIYAPEHWWIRLILWMVAVLVFVIAHRAVSIVNQKIKEQKKKEKEEKTDFQFKKLEKMEKARKEYN